MAIKFSLRGVTLHHVQTFQILCASLDVITVVILVMQHALMCINVNPSAEEVHKRRRYYITLLFKGKRQTMLVQ